MKKDSVIAIVVSLVIGIGGGFAIANRTQNKEDTSSEVAEHTHSESDDHGSAPMRHEHGVYEVDSNNAPTVDLAVEEDAKSGWNVTLKTSNFTFSPENVNKDNIQGEGHAHLYIDNKKIARLYGSYFHYDGQVDDTATFRVTLNSNDHSEYAVNGKVIEASKEIAHEHSPGSAH